MHRVVLSCLLVLSSVLVGVDAAGAGDQGGNPSVRAITAFVDLDPVRYEQQFSQTASRLQQAKGLFEKSGFAVQTVRITTQPFMQYVGGMSRDEALTLFRRLEDLAKQNNVLVNIGPAVLDDQPDPKALELLDEVHSRGSQLNSSMIVASENGIHWNTVQAAAHHVWRVAARSPHSQGTFSFTATAMLTPGSPFFPGSYHLKNAGSFSIGLQAANVVADVFARVAAHPAGTKEASVPSTVQELARALSEKAVQVHKIAAEIERQTGWKYWGFDPTPAPLKNVSIGTAMESLSSTAFGSSGTMTAAYIITEAVHQVPGPRVGYAGLMLPVLEDTRLAQLWSEGVINVDSLLAYSAVCGTGLDAVPLPGDITEQQLTRIIGDVAVLAFKWKKPLTARLQPVHGRRAGEMTEFDSPYLENAKLQPVR